MRIKTGIEGLDKMLKGGLLQGRNILVTGPCGSGKSTLAMQFICNCVSSGEPGLYITLEESKEKIFQDMLNFGFDLEALEKTGNFIMVGGPVAELKSYMNKADAEVTHIIKEIEEIVRTKGIKRVAIDSINLLTVLMSSDDERRRAIAEICGVLSKMKCTSMLLSETREGSMELSRYGMEEFVVDGVVVLYLVRQGSRFVPGIAIRKMRGSDHDKEIRVFSITPNGIVVYPEEAMFTNI